MNNHKKFLFYVFGLTFLVLGFLPKGALSCEPIVPLAMLFAGPHFITGTIIGFVFAVGVKCVSFLFFEKDLSKLQAVLFMFLANLVTTVIGIFVAVGYAVPSAIFVFIPLVYIFTIIPSKRLRVSNKIPMVKKFNHHVLAIIFILFYVGSGILFGVAIKYQSENLILYWILKFLYVYLALIISIGLTVLWEEWVVFKLAKRSKSGVQNFYSAVLKANLVTLLVFMGAAAILMLPKRFASPDFLALFF